MSIEEISPQRYWKIFDHIKENMEQRGDTRDPHEVTKAHIDKYYGKDKSNKN